jgi:hypothetical protein
VTAVFNGVKERAAWLDCKFAEHPGGNFGFARFTVLSERVAAKV